MSIFPLPVFEADADPDRREAMSDREIYARLKPPTSIVIRYGVMGAVAEYPYDGPAKPGCGSKLVARTHRGLEVVEMLTTTCSNSGCGKSVSRQEMLEYIENSGGREYPFRTDGKILRVATIDDLARWSASKEAARQKVAPIKLAARELGLAMKIVEVEPILGGEILTVYYTAEERIDFRDLVKRIASEFKTRIEMRQVGARDEARLVADYERCGQHCCCKNFLKVLKPISMRSAKTQKGTVDPLKISGRCGRLMCCLRYEDETYEDLKKRLPKNRTRVGTPDGPGTVLDSKILVQLVLVKLERDGREVAVPVEELCDPEACPPPESSEPDPFRGIAAESATRLGRRDRESRQDRQRSRVEADGEPPIDSVAPATEGSDTAEPGRKRKRRRRRGGQAAAGEDASSVGPAVEGASDAATAPGSPPAEGDTTSGGRKRKRRRKRKGGGGAASGAPSDSSGGDASGDVSPASNSEEAGGSSGEGGAPRKRRRRRRRGRGDSDASAFGDAGE